MKHAPKLQNDRLVCLQFACSRRNGQAGVQIVGIDETSLRRGPHDFTVVHDLDAKRLLFAAEGRDLSAPTLRALIDFLVDAFRMRAWPA